MVEDNPEQRGPASGGEDGAPPEMDYSTLPRVIMDEKNIRILSATAFRPLSAREIAYMFNIPLVSCYRKMGELEKLGLIKCVDRPLTQSGKRVKVYKSQLLKVAVTFEGGKLKIVMDVAWRKTQHFEISWSQAGPKDDPSAAPEGP
ncbi:MAG TPA: winged helix-turn-helix domain-containing protein [Candidatus Thermoplasmatota archaeon]